MLTGLPLMIGIGMILATNNTCDIEKDIASKRHTLAVTLGREQAPMFYKLALIVWMAVTLILEPVSYTHLGKPNEPCVPKKRRLFSPGHH